MTKTNRQKLINATVDLPCDCGKTDTRTIGELAVLAAVPAHTTQYDWGGKHECSGLKFRHDCEGCGRRTDYVIDDLPDDFDRLVSKAQRDGLTLTQS